MMNQVSDERKQKIKSIEEQNKIYNSTTEKIETTTNSKEQTNGENNRFGVVAYLLTDKLCC